MVKIIRIQMKQKYKADDFAEIPKCLCTSDRPVFFL